MLKSLLFYLFAAQIAVAQSGPVSPQGNPGTAPVSPAPVSPSANNGTPNGAEAKGKKEDIIVSEITEYLMPFTYDREKFRDPFETKSANAPLRPGQVYGPFLEIQTHPLSAFTLKGLLWRTDTPKALFVGPENKEYRLSVKDYIGENFGYIATIRENEVVVIQTIEENQKRYSTTKVVFLEPNK